MASSEPVRRINETREQLLEQRDDLRFELDRAALERLDLERQLSRERATSKAYRGASMMFAGATIVLLLGHIWRSAI